MSHYAIYGGIAGGRRMEVVARAYWPTTLPFLRQAGIGAGMQCLDLGCGAGEVTFKIAQLIAPQGHVLGIDMDAVKLDVARRRAVAEGVTNADFQQKNVFEWEDDSIYSLIYVRFLLTHLPGCGRILPKLFRALRPGGSLLIEDTEFQGYVAHPANAAHARYVELYREVLRRRGGDADIGPKLPAMLSGAGFEQIGLNIVYPEHKEGSGKEISILTMDGISAAVLEEKLIEQAELRELLSEIERYTREPLSIVCGPRVFQVWGRRPC